MAFSKDHILAQLDTILSDKAFARSKTNCRLLKFLVIATIEGNDVKEATIGKEFFGAKYDPVKSDNNVRVYIYHLRKKLDEYYLNKAEKEEIIFSIAKGQYNVQFSEFQEERTHKKSKPQAYIFCGILMVVLLGVLLYQKPVNDFWKTLMSNDKPTSVIYGDYFTIETTVNTGRQGVIRDYEINNEAELEAYLNEHPELANDMRASRHHYYNWLAPYSSRIITEFWTKYDYPFEIIQGAEWSVSQLETENLIYFGQSKTMGVLKDILTEAFPQYSFKSQRIFRVNPATNKREYYSDDISSNERNTDYTIVSKITLPTGNELRYFLSDQDIGAITTLQYFMDNDSVDAFYKRHELEEGDDFLALFKVTGWKRKSFNMEFVLIDKKK